MDFISITPDPLDIAHINSITSAHNCGAISLFVGTTRNNFEGKKVISLEYECYKPMAEKQLKNICVDIRQIYPDIVNITIHHRVGLVPMGEASVIVALSSPHRQSSLEALPIIMEQLKSRVPIWKKELYEKDENASNWKSRTFLKIDPKILNEHVNNRLVQINAEVEEVEKRVEFFIQRKRREIDEANSLNESFDQLETEDCARTNPTFIDSRVPKVRRVDNCNGPQLNACVFRKEIKNKNSYERKSSEFSDMTLNIDERISEIENYIGTPKAVLIVSRLKNIENRLLYLETVSPEYKHFVNKTSTTPTDNITPEQHSSSRRIKYTAENIVELMNNAKYI